MKRPGVVSCDVFCSVLSRAERARNQLNLNVITRNIQLYSKFIRYDMSVIVCGVLGWGHVLRVRVMCHQLQGPAQSPPVGALAGQINPSLPRVGGSTPPRSARVCFAL